MDVVFPARLKQCMTQNGRLVRLRDLAEALNIPLDRMKAFELGVETPTMAELRAMALYFEVTADFLLGIDYRLMVDVSPLKPEQYALIEYLITAMSEAAVWPPREPTNEIEEGSGLTKDQRALAGYLVKVLPGYQPQAPKARAIPFRPKAKENVRYGID